jgi:pimeloyl-ACP methyl ester carboxylesterase
MMKFKTAFLVALCLTMMLAAPVTQAQAGQAGKGVAKTAKKLKKFDAHESFARLHFTDQEMDFAFALILGATMNHGCEVGEAYYTATNIKEGSAASWQDEWIKMAQRVEARGEASLAGGHRVSAREQFQRASYYYRAALISMMPQDPKFKTTALKSRALLKQAGTLFNPPLEYIEIPFEGTVLPGYYRKADCGAKQCKTLVMLGGGETFAEDLVFYIAPQAHDRGYNFITVDLPGQGLLPLEGKVFRADVEVPVKAVLDYVLSRPEVAPDRVAAYGISGGGGFVPRAAMHDPRIKAIAMNSAVVDAHPLFASMPVATATEDIVRGWSTFKQNTVRAIAWRWGVDMHNIPGLVPANKGFDFDPAKITVPALLIVGQGEYSNAEVKRQQKLCYDSLPGNMKKLVVTPANEGASNHCITENRSVMSLVVLDFFDEAFK